jgi:hypothetical protein
MMYCGRFPRVAARQFQRLWLPPIGLGEGQSDAQTIWCELVTMAVRNALDDAVEAEAAKVVCQFSDGVVGWIEAALDSHLWDLAANDQLVQLTARSAQTFDDGWFLFDHSEA